MFRLGCGETRSRAPWGTRSLGEGGSGHVTAMAERELTDEHEHLALREQQRVQRLDAEQGLSRRDFITLGAAASPLAGTSLGRPARAVAQSSPSSPIVKPLPPEWFPPLGTNAEMRDSQLLARATDESGAMQPDTVPFNAGGHQFWAVVRHPVTVARAAR